MQHTTLKKNINQIDPTRLETLPPEIEELQTSLKIQRNNYTNEKSTWRKHEIKLTGTQTKKRLNRLKGVYKRKSKENLDDWGSEVVDNLF